MPGISSRDHAKKQEYLSIIRLSVSTFSEFTAARIAISSCCLTSSIKLQTWALFRLFVQGSTFSPSRSMEELNSLEKRTSQEYRGDKVKR
jgi:hypothetical protein